MRVFFALLFFGVPGVCRGQSRLPHAPGPVIVSDMNRDGNDDFLVIDPTGFLRTYLGGGSHPHFFGTVSSAFPPGGLAEMPLWHDSRLWAIRRPATSGAADIELYNIAPNGQATMQATMTVPRVDAGALVSDRQIVPRNQDFDGDGRLDATLYWMEQRSGVATVWATDLTPAASPPRQISLPPATARFARLVEAHPVQSLTQGSGEVMLTLSSGIGEFFGGFGFVLDGPNLPADSHAWLTGYPSLLADDPTYTDPIVASGRFSPMIGFDSPFVKTALGVSFLPWPDARAPFVGHSGTVVETSSHGKAFPMASADFNRDGSDEMVWLENVRENDLSELVVADPGPGRGAIRILDLEPGSSGTHLPRYVVTGDFNGDGWPDLLFLSRIPAESQRCRIGIFLNDGTDNMTFTRAL